MNKEKLDKGNDLNNERRKLERQLLGLEANIKTEPFRRSHILFKDYDDAGHFVASQIEYVNADDEEDEFQNQLFTEVKHLALNIMRIKIEARLKEITEEFDKL